MRQKKLPRRKRSLSQVYLKTDWPVSRMLEKLQSWNVRRVLEIGPGPGVLTFALLRAGIKVTAVEKDDQLYERLQHMVALDQIENGELLELINNDTLRFDLGSWISRSNEQTAVVGNIPYNISTPILMWSIPHLKNLKGLIYLTQLEFAQRLAANPGTKAYGSLSVYTQLRSKPSLECKVDRACFHPPPKVDSAIISLTEKPHQLSDKLLVKSEMVTRTCFMQRRKVLRNAVRNFLTAENEANFPIDLNRRPDTLRPEEYVELTKHLFSKEF